MKTEYTFVYTISTMPNGHPDKTRKFTVIADSRQEAYNKLISYMKSKDKYLTITTPLVDLIGQTVVTANVYAVIE